MEKTYHIGVDGGASKTTCSIIDNENNLIASHTCGSTNPQSVGKEQAFSNLKEVLSRTLNKSQIKSKDLFLSIGLAMSGNDTPDDAVVFEKLAKKVLKLAGLEKARIIVENDAAGPLCATTLGKMEGIVLISGTGMICFGFSTDPETGKAVQYRVGGWGPIFLDKGSGYWIGQKALEKVSEIFDGRTDEKSVLSEAILKDLGLGNCPTKLIPYVYEKNDHGRVAKICKTVCENYEEDMIAKTIIRDAVKELVGYVGCMCEKLEKCLGERKIKLVLSGSVLTHKGSVVAKLLKEEVEKSFGNVFEEICFPKLDPSVGAALLYKSL